MISLTQHPISYSALSASPKGVWVFTDAGYDSLDRFPIYIAHVIRRAGEKDIINSKTIHVKPKSSTYAEYLALIYAMKYCLRIGEKNVHFLSDNEVMVKQLNGAYGVHKLSLQHMKNAVDHLWGQFDIVFISHILRAYNVADEYVNIERGKGKCLPKL